MPKFITYQRPAPISRQNWNHAPDRKADAPRRAPGPKPQGAPLDLPALQKLIRKD